MLANAERVNANEQQIHTPLLRKLNNNTTSHNLLRFLPERSLEK